MGYMTLSLLEVCFPAPHVPSFCENVNVAEAGLAKHPTLSRLIHSTITHLGTLVLTKNIRPSPASSQHSHTPRYII